MPIAKTNTINTWYETFGSRDHPAIILCAGGFCQGILWDESLCKMLWDLGFYVIRYDYRDTGHSTAVDYEKEPYNMRDLADDGIALLDYLDIEKAHVIALSTGGFVAMTMASRYPNRVSSLLLISTTPDHRSQSAAYVKKPTDHLPLPPPKPIYLEFMDEFINRPPQDEDELAKLRVKAWRILNGDRLPFDEEQNLQIQKLFIKRSLNPESLTNHLPAMEASHEMLTQDIKNITCQTTIIHGHQDIILSIEHAKALLDAIEQAKLVEIDDYGHVLNPKIHPTVCKEISLLHNKVIS